MDEDKQKNACKHIWENILKSSNTYTIWKGLRIVIPRKKKQFWEDNMQFNPSFYGIQNKINII